MSKLRQMERGDADVPLPEQRAASLLGAFALAVTDGLEECHQSGPEPLSLTAGAALHLVRELPGIQLTELRLALGVTHSACVRTVDQLQRARLVERIPDLHDARATLLRVTREGDRRARDLSMARSTFTESLVKRIPPYWRPRMVRVLERLLAELTPDARTGLRVCRHCERGICRVDPGSPCPVVERMIERVAIADAEAERARQIPWWYDALPAEERPPLPPLDLQPRRPGSPYLAARWMIALARDEDAPGPRQGRCRRRR